MGLKASIFRWVGLLIIFTVFSHTQGFVGHKHGKPATNGAYGNRVIDPHERDFLPCGSIVQVENDKKYFIRSEKCGGSKAPLGPFHRQWRESNKCPYDNDRRRPNNRFNSRPSAGLPMAGTIQQQNVNPALNTSEQAVHEIFLRSNCIWKFQSSGACTLMVHFERYLPGQRQCNYQYVLVSDEDHEIQACGSRRLPRAFHSTTNVITVKHYRDRRVRNSAHFQGYAVCHSSGHHVDPLYNNKYPNERISPYVEDSVRSPVVVGYMNSFPVPKNASLNGNVPPSNSTILDPLAANSTIVPANGTTSNATDDNFITTAYGGGMFINNGDYYRDDGYN